MSRIAAYNFLANILGVDRFESDSDLDVAISNGVADKRCIPSPWYSVYDIDKQKYIAELWTSRHGFEVFKTSDGIVTEHYRKQVGGNDIFISLDLISNHIIEYYRLVDGDLVKFDYITHDRLGHTTDCTFETLPEEYKIKLANHPNKDGILYWADKPYGRVVGIIL